MSITTITSISSELFAGAYPFGYSASQPQEQADTASEGAPLNQVQPSAQDRSAPLSADPHTLTQAEQASLQELQDRDAEVRRHEVAHLMAAGPYAQRPPRYEYETGPDGKRYVSEGQVNLDTRPIAGDPEATIRKAQMVRKAALAAEEPSTQDRKVAADAKAMEAKARQNLQQQRLEMARSAHAATTQTLENRQVIDEAATVEEVETLQFTHEATAADIHERATTRLFQPENAQAFVVPSGYAGEDTLRHTGLQPHRIDWYA